MTNQAPLELYRFALSGHCHRVELLLSLAQLPYESVSVDLAAGAQKSPAFLAMNSFGQVPVLRHGDFTLSDSNAILVYLAEQFPSAAVYLPKGARARAEVQRWLSVAAGPLAQGPAAARAVKVFGRKLDHAQAQGVAQALFQVLEQELSTRQFLVGSAPTLADLALYAYTAHASEGEVSLEPYPQIRAWLARIEALPHFTPMQKARK
ncbi:MAG: glutathione S-transferase [Polyangiaceae bacterium]